MDEGPYTSELRDGLLTLTLDTPRASVNIFDARAAAQLASILENLPRGTRAIVFASGKRGSFINGAALMMASAVKSIESAKRVTGGVVRAYELVERSPVPTIAAVRGNCFGCGVEFTLRCTHRIASDAFDTQFYMTELNDYLLSPAFGSVLRLPRMLGIDRAADFLLWGERWTGREAKRAGLVDRVVDDREFARELPRIVRGLLGRSTGRKPAPSDAPALARHRARIESLPPQQQPLYRDCLDLMAAAARRVPKPEDQEREFALAAKTSSMPAAKHALAFFFVRQIADEVCRRKLVRKAERGIFLKPSSDRAVAAFAREVGSRRLPPIGRALSLRVGGEQERCELAARLSITGAPVSCDLLLYRPERRARRAMIELIVRKKSEHAALLFDHLMRAGFVPFLSNGDRPAIDRLLIAHFTPLVAALDRISPSAINQTLRLFGFVQRPHTLLARFGRARLQRLLGADLRPLEEERSAGRSDPRLLEELSFSWLVCARELLATRAIDHPTIVDLIAREILGFPLEHQSLCAHLTRARVRETLDRLEIENEDAEAYASGRHDFYA